MSQTVTCPNCSTQLRSKRPVPEGAGLRCPGCKTKFGAPATAPAARPMGLGLILGAGAALVLGAAVVTVVVVAALSPRPAPPVQAVKDDPKPETKDEPKPVADDDRLEAERKKAADALAKVEELNRKLEAKGLLAKAKSALAKNDFAEAEKLFAQARDLAPSDPEAADGLVDSKVKAIAAQKADEEAKKRKQELDRLLDDGKKALGDKKFADAVRSFEAARAIDPLDKAVREALDDARAAAAREDGDKKRLDDYAARVEAGKAAMKAEKFLDAVREFQAAARLMPDDLNARNLVKGAEDKIAVGQDKQKRQAAFDGFVDRARKAQAATRFDEAIQAIDSALRLSPDDREAKTLSRDVRAALAKAKADNARLLAQADEALRLGQPAEAKRLAADAVRNWAEDERAERALRNAERFVVEGGDDEQALLRAAYNRAVRLGQAAVLAERWADAVVAYGEAVRLLPNDLVSARELERARRQLRVTAERRVEYDRQMKVAANALSLSQFNRAIDAYQDALRAAPGDALAVAALSQARYLRGLAEGDRLWAQLGRNPTNALRDAALAAYRSALDEKPNDLTARGKLNQVLAFRVPVNPPPRDPTPKDRDKTPAKDKMPAKDKDGKTKGK